jgi:hypothetical protein
MRRADILGAGQVGDRAGELEHAMVCARREVQLPYRRLHQPLARRIQLAVLAHRRKDTTLRALSLVYKGGAMLTLSLLCSLIRFAFRDKSR